MAIDSIPALLFKQAASQPDRPAYYEKIRGEWQPTRWADYGAQVQQASRALIALGFEAGQKVCILGFNRPEWVLMDVAAIATGGAPAGIYITSSPSEVAYILNHSEAPIVLLEDAEQWAKVLEEMDNLPHLKHVVMMKGADLIDHEMVMTWEEFLARGAEVPAGKVDERLEALEEDGLATLIYTSGTTGPPKAVMLSNHNLVWTIRKAATVADVEPTDTIVSYLPLSHIAEQLFTIHGPVVMGFTVYFAESIPKLPDNLKEVKPSIVFGVPRIWEKMYGKVSETLGAATGAKAKLVEWAMQVGRAQLYLRHHGKPLTRSLKIQKKIAHKLIYSKVREAMGFQNARICVTAAAPLSRDIIEFFEGLDIPIQEVYGQSEDTGPATFNHVDHARLGTVGRPYSGTELRIADDGEICLKGPHVFLGYYKDQAATDEALVDGWLHTGDLGSVDREGFVRITGRKKEIIVTSGGKNITPINIEERVNKHPLVSQSVLIGDARKFISALITLEPDKASAWAKENGTSVAAMPTDDRVLQSIQQHLDEVVNPEFARVEHVRKFTLLPREFSVDEEELTPTMKLKRRVVYEHFAGDIEAMYEG